MGFCWGQHIKECFPEADMGKDLGRLVKEHFFEADTGERMFFLLKQVCERTRDERFFTNSKHVLSALHSVFELHLLGTHREKHTQTLVVVCPVD